MGIRSPKLLILGLARFGIILVLTLALTSTIFYYHDHIMQLFWQLPDNRWLVWLWHILSWTVSILLAAIALFLAYIFSQLFFCLIIMDWMSRHTEKIVTGRVANPDKTSVMHQLWFLFKQEIPRTIVPLLFTLVIMLLGWLTPLGPFITIAASAIAAVFLAWDNTDLLPARRLVPFKQRFEILSRHFFFHLGFGLLFLIPFVNLILISFAPVGGTLFALNSKKTKTFRPHAHFPHNKHPQAP
jgi:CysZ protein